VPFDLDLAAMPVVWAMGTLVVVSAVAGVVNTMAGGGSLLLLPVLVGLGLPPSVANGTLRVGILVQSVTSSLAFRRRGVRERFIVVRLVVPMALGAAGGTWLATRLPDDLLRPIFGGVLALWAIILVVRPGRFLEPPPQPETPGLGMVLVAGLVGVYGGFLQAGVGFPLMAMLVIGLGYPAVRANAAKVALVVGYTLISLPLFAWAGHVAWREGAAIAVGSLVGGWLGTHWQIQSGARIVRWFVVAAVALSGVAMLVSGLRG
jgi:uncharacterized protein